MASNSTNMLLKLWTSAGDYFSYTDLYQNFNKIDSHDHTTNKGVQITNAALAGSISNDKFVAGVNPVLSQTLPTAGLFDGYTVNLTDNTGSPNWVWQMRYTSSGSRWEFVGGSWYQNDSSSAVAVTNSTDPGAYLSTIQTNAVQFAIPAFLATGASTASCKFRVETFAYGTQAIASATPINVSMSLATGTPTLTTISGSDTQWSQSATGTSTIKGVFSGFKSFTISGNTTALTAGTTLTAQFKSVTANASITQHSVSIRPTYIDIL